MSKKKNNSHIKCEVDSCRYNDNEEGKCELEEIEVGYNDNNITDDCTDSSDTACQSFSSFEDCDQALTDEVYEVQSESEDVELEDI